MSLWRRKLSATFLIAVVVVAQVKNRSSLGTPALSVQILIFLLEHGDQMRLPLSAVSKFGCLDPSR